MPAESKPEKIYAWIVAVEKYAAGLDVKAPIGGWAIDLAERLLKRDASAHIVLSTSLLRPEHEERLKALEKKVVRMGASQAELQNALARLHGQGTLLVYWVGHGIMDSAGRSLLAADSSQPGELRSLSADSLLTHFRSPEFPRTQIGFFDCCAQVVGAPNRLQPGGEGKTKTRQFFYYAASAAEAAAADTTREGFSSTAIRALGESADWPPNPVSLFQTIRTRLNTLPLATRPFALEWTEESGDLWSRQGQSAASDELMREARRARLSWSEFEHLLSQAGGCTTAAELSQAIRLHRMPRFLGALRAKKPGDAAVDLLKDGWRRLVIERQFQDECLALSLFWDDWLALHKETCDLDLLDNLSGIEDLPHLILSVLDHGTAENGLSSLIRLLELAARRAKKQNPAASARLIEAIKKHAKLAPLYDAAVRKLPKEDSHSYLLLGLQYEPNSSKRVSLVKSWLLTEGVAVPVGLEGPPPESLAAELNAVIQRVIQQHPERPLVIELLTPNDLLCAPRGLFEIVDEELGTSIWLEEDHAITVRWHDRMKGQDARYHPGTWLQVATAARVRISQAVKLVCEWDNPGVQGSEHHVLGLTFPGPCPADPKRNRGAFFTALKKGRPFMCWPRDTPIDVKSFAEAASKFIEQHDLSQLPDALRVRRQADPALRDLVLLIDEPDRNPYQQKFQDPTQRGTA